MKPWSSTLSWALWFLAGCHPGPSPQLPPPPTAPTGLELRQAMDRAAGVAKTVDRQAEVARRQIDGQESGDHSP